MRSTGSASSCASWTGDGAFDRAVLVESETESDEADLLIYLSEPPGGMRRALAKTTVAWRGMLWGTQPSLATSGCDSIVVTSRNDAIGRTRWTRRLTVAYRERAFVVAGYVYVERDTVVPAARASCEVNFLTGRGVKNGTAFRVPAGAVPLADWSVSSRPAQCR